MICTTRVIARIFAGCQALTGNVDAFGTHSAFAAAVGKHSAKTMNSLAQSVLSGGLCQIILVTHQHLD